MSIKMHDGTEFKALSKLWMHDGTEFKQLQKAWMHDGTEFKLTYTGGPQLTVATAVVNQYGTDDGGGVCVDPHINRISWTLDAACTGGYTIAIYEPGFGEIVSGLDCTTSPYDHTIEGQVSSAGTGLSFTYTVRVYLAGDITHFLAASTITAQDDGSCIVL